MTHTPGPWHRNTSARYPIFAERTPGKKDWVYVANSYQASPNSGVLPEEEEANLNLIAAAPDMLAALERLYWKAVDYHRRLSDNPETESPEYVEQLGQYLKSAQAAINQAKGI